MAKEGFIGALGRFAASLSDAAPEGPRNAWSAIGPWVADLTRSASQLWLPFLLTGIPCEVVQRHPTLGIGIPCTNPSIAACLVCRKPVCLDHAFVARSGQTVCFPCIKQDVDDHAAAPAPHRGHSPHPGTAPPHEDPARRYDPPPPPPPPPPPDPTLPARLQAARKVLKVKRTASWAEVEAAYKDLLRKHHPDRNPEHLERSTVLFKEVRSAYDLLKQHHAGAPS
jgi:hypothetical protein